jgi:hypothetical protein
MLLPISDDIILLLDNPNPTLKELEVVLLATERTAKSARTNTQVSPTDFTKLWTIWQSAQRNMKSGRYVGGYSDLGAFWSEVLRVNCNLKEDSWHDQPWPGDLPRESAPTYSKPPEEVNITSCREQAQASFNKGQKPFEPTDAQYAEVFNNPPDGTKIASKLKIRLPSGSKKPKPTPKRKVK